MFELNLSLFFKDYYKYIGSETDFKIITPSDGTAYYIPLSGIEPGDRQQLEESIKTGAPVPPFFHMQKAMSVALTKDATVIWDFTIGYVGNIPGFAPDFVALSGLETKLSLSGGMARG